MVLTQAPIRELRVHPPSFLAFPVALQIVLYGCQGPSPLARANLQEGHEEANTHAPHTA